MTATVTDILVRGRALASADLVEVAQSRGLKEIRDIQVKFGRLGKVDGLHPADELDR